MVTAPHSGDPRDGLASGSSAECRALSSQHSTQKRLRTKSNFFSKTQMLTTRTSSASSLATWPQTSVLISHQEYARKLKSPIFSNVADKNDRSKRLEHCCLAKDNKLAVPISGIYLFIFLKSLFCIETSVHK